MERCPVATLVLNPALDVTYEISKLVADQKLHAEKTYIDPGGNGINVARALKRLQVPAGCFTILAGEIGELLYRLIRRRVADLHVRWIEGETRINCTVLQREPHAQFEISGVGPTPPEAVQEALIQAFLQEARNGIGVLTGSLPPGVSEAIYGELTERLRAENARSVVDATGEPLRQVLHHHPFLIKPNRYELEEVLGQAVPDVEAAAEAAWFLHRRRGVHYVCVSLGRDGAILAGPEGVLHGIAPSVRVVSTVGAGDSMVAGLVAAFAQGWSAEEALKLGIACGAGTVEQPGTELFRLDRVEDLIPCVKIRRLR